ncbi:MAG TPA: hypothetical protein VK903_04855 [Propionicimonas sp.]|nr:hypothetical protein [Propionicimonas sp.]
MGRRTPRRRLRLTAWLAALLLAFTGCAQGAPAASGTLADHLNAALRARSQPAFLENFTTDAAGTTLGTTWFTVLGRGNATFTMMDATSVRVKVRLPGDEGPATWTLPLDLDGRSWFGPGRIRAVEPQPERPIWALGQVDLSAATHGTVLSSGLDDAARHAWAERLDRAAEAVEAVAPPGVEGWQGGLVVDVPASTSDFQAITDELPSTAAALASCSTGTPRVVINPQILGDSDDLLDATMVHEAVHVATDSVCGRPDQALSWAVEGLAESVTARVYPSIAAENREAVRTYLRDNPMPKSLPTQLDDLASYALAQLAVDQVRAQLGDKADDLLYRAIHRSASVTPAELRRVTGWYLSALRRTAATR